MEITVCNFLPGFTGTVYLLHHLIIFIHTKSITDLENKIVDIYTNLVKLTP